MSDDIESLKKEIQQLTQAVHTLQAQVKFLHKQVHQQKFTNDQFKNNIRRVAASR